MLTALLLVLASQEPVPPAAPEGSPAGVAAAQSDAAEWIQLTSTGSVDWSRLLIIVQATHEPVGAGPGADRRRWATEEAATALARQRVLQTLGEISIVPNVTGSERLKEPSVRAQIEGLYDICESRDLDYGADGSVRLTLECPLGLGFSAALAPGRSPPRTDAKEEGPSAVIFLAKPGLVPSLVPLVVGPDDDVLYGPDVPGPDARLLRGMAAYARDAEVAKRLERAGSSPLIVNADVREDGALVVDGPTASLVQSASGALIEGRVIVVSAPAEGS